VLRAVGSALGRYEFVAHVYIAATGPHADEGYAWLRALWNELGVRFGIAHAFENIPEELPADVSVPSGDGVVAARKADGPAQRQAVVRRIGDVLCLSAVFAPPAGDRPTWDTLDGEWATALPPRADGVLGSVRIVQAELADPACSLDATALGPVVGGLLVVPGDWAARGVVRAEPPWGSFAVWEASDHPVTDDRFDRRLVVIAPHGRGHELSAWTWTYDRELPPLARYLMHAAKVRFELRVWAADTSRSQLRRDTDRAIARLLRLADQVRDGHEPDPAALMDVSVPLTRLQAGELGLVDRASRLRDMRRAVQVAATNMAALARNDQDGGLFADDRDLAEWFQRQLDHDAGFLDSAAERARTVAALGDQLVTRGLASHQERVNLGLTGVIGAVLLVLAAIQSLGYQFPLEPRVKDAVIPPAIAVSGAIALVLSMIVLRTASRRRALPAAVLSASVSLLAAAAVWLGIAVVCVVTAVALPAPGVIAAWAGLGAVLAGTASYRVPSRR